MPVDLNGKYWTLNELAEETGLDYTGISRKVKTLPEGVITLGRAFVLVEDEAARAMMDELEKSKDLKTAYSLAVTMQTAVTTMNKVIDAGIPFIVVDGVRRVRADWIPCLKKAFKIGRMKKEVSRVDLAEFVAKKAIELKAKDGD